MKLNDQEVFWKGKFGDEYSERNKEGNRLNQFSKILLNNRINIKSAIELGANVGLNLDAIKKNYPNCDTFGIEINEKAFNTLIKNHNGFLGSVKEYNKNTKYELVFTSYVLIHQNPNTLDEFYDKIYSISAKYILISEYFSPYPVEVNYRNNSDKLFKRDFASELWNKFPNLELIDYGFFWSKDRHTWGDDVNWFLFKK